MKKRVLAALLAASMALCAGCGSQTSDDGEEQTAAGTAVEVAEVTKGAMSTEYSVNGKVAADNEVQVFPMLAGQVLTLSVSEGDKVTKGQTLLNVDTSSVTSTMSSLRESYNATKTATEKAIENAQIGVEQAQLAVENTEALLEAGAAAEQDLTKAKQGLAQAQAGVQQARAQQAASLAQIQASIDQQAGLLRHGDRALRGHGHGGERRAGRHGLLRTAGGRHRRGQPRQDQRIGL